MTLRPVKFLDKQSPPHVATLIILASMSALVMNLFLPSLPGMTEYFGTEYRIMQLSVAINLATSGILQIFIGPLADRFGRRPVILGGMSIFMLATIGCIFSTNIWVFLFFRALQAFVATAMVLSRAIVRDIHPQDKAASMIGYVTMGMSISPMVGPAIGGILDQAFGWQANFVALFIVGGLTILLVFVDLGETAPSKGQRFADQVQDYPILLKSPRFWGYTSACGFSSGAFFAYLGGAPFVGSQVFHLDPAILGLYFATPSLGYFFGNYISGRYSIQFGVNKMVLWGVLISTVGILINLLFSFADANTPLIFFGLMITLGLGNGMTIPNATAGALSVRPNLAGTASGLSGAMMIGGGAVLSAIAGNMLTPGSDATPLLWIMLITSLLSVLAICIVIWRENQLISQQPTDQTQKSTSKYPE